ncbi:transcription elongation factor [Vibrio aquaticus]|uniref:Transcription elongation factor n=1 Tax=Vibrio aquaticus TaxID=2496559 RepID=A0A432CWE4_9VIBR|nr:GreA/GreB family elongation factor [Vibrio aquaticus]RTZ16084.1 transcription elongation factor [Vibrio aquaticus]
MNKLELRQTILTLLQHKLAIAVSSAQRAMESATDEETVPEHKYDTLALEASYLAHGQAMRVQECEEEIRQMKELVLPDTPEKVVLGSLVTLLDLDEQPRLFFLAPCSGGLKVECGEESLMLVTFDSPLGKAMRSKQVGDEVEYSVGSFTHCYDIESIH